MTDAEEAFGQACEIVRHLCADNAVDVASVPLPVHRMRPAVPSGWEDSMPKSGLAFPVLCGEQPMFLVLVLVHADEAHRVFDLAETSPAGKAFATAMSIASPCPGGCRLLVVEEPNGRCAFFVSARYRSFVDMQTGVLMPVGEFMAAATRRSEEE